LCLTDLVDEDRGAERALLFHSLTSQLYKGAQAIADFAKEHAQHPAAAKVPHLLGSARPCGEEPILIVLDVVPALLLLMLSAFGGVDTDVVRSRDALERFGALYLHARVDAPLYCAKVRLIEADTFMPKLLAPFNACGLKEDAANGAVAAPGLTLAPLVHLWRPFPSTNRSPVSRPLVPTGSDAQAQVVVNGPRAPFADAWLSLPLGNGKRLFLAMRAGHVANATGNAQVCVEGECGKVGFSSEEKRLSNLIPSTQEENDAKADALNAVRCSRSAWELLCDGGGESVVRLAFLTNGKFTDTAVGEMSGCDGVCVSFTSRTWMPWCPLPGRCRSCPRQRRMLRLTTAHLRAARLR